MKRVWTRASLLGLGLMSGLLILGRMWPVRGEKTGTNTPATSPEPAVTSPQDSSGVTWDSRLGSPPRFVDIADAAGVRFTHFNGKTGRFLYPEIMGGGVALFDYDGDGFLDIYFVNGNLLVGAPSSDITNHLYHNNGDGTFTDVTEKAGVGDTGYGQGACVGDYDNDGDPDLYVSNFGPNVLYRNNGNGTFTEVAREAGVADPSWGQSCSFLDCDGDGWLDLYVQNYLTYSVDTDLQAFLQHGDRRILDYAAPSSFPGSADRLFRNLGNGTFADVTVAAGLYRPGGKGMGCACVDFDGDGRVDLFVANDGMENYLFRSRGGGAFEEVGLAAGVAFDGSGIPEASMGADVGDFDGDQRLDLISPCVRKQTFTLYRNMGTYFADATCEAGLNQVTSGLTGFSPGFIDYDNDGDLHLFFTTGAVRTIETVPPDAPYEERYGMPDLLLANDGIGHYVDVSRQAGPHFLRKTIGRGSAVGDIDNDGDLDIAVSNLNGRPAILRNDSPSGHWITLRLIPSSGNRDALGAIVVLDAMGRRRLGAVHGGVTYLSQADRRVHFGLGAADRIDRIEIRWPSGERQALENVPVDRFLTVRQGKGIESP